MDKSLSMYCGKCLKDMSREELIDTAYELGEAHRKEMEKRFESEKQAFSELCQLAGNKH